MLSVPVSITIRIALIGGLLICFLDCFYILYTMDDALISNNDKGTKKSLSSYEQLFASDKNSNTLLGIGISPISSTTDAIGITNQLRQQQLVSSTNITDEQRRQLLAFDKTQILSLLDDAGIDIEKLDLSTLSKLPSWTQVTNLYGKGPIIVGLDTCNEYQTQSGEAEDHLVGTAGTFNTGTNLLSELLIHNCYLPKRVIKHGIQSRGVRWQVPWGKHTPVDDENFRRTHKTDNDIVGLDVDNVLPVVVIRDPARWMASMCHHPYAMEWIHNDIDSSNHRIPYTNTNKHCPNLVPNKVDIELDPSLAEQSSVPVKIVYAKFIKTYQSMIHHWNEYYDSYITQSQNVKKFPRIVVRYEDVIFYPMEVTKSICQCAGGMLYDENHLNYVVKSAKNGVAGHGDTTDMTGYIDSIIKYGTDHNRWANMTIADLQYLSANVNSDLMRLFHYQYPNSTTNIAKP